MIKNTILCRQMYPMVCFTCGRPIAHLWLDYFDILNKAKRTTPKVDIDYETDTKYNALIKLGIGDECCRRMFISQIESIYDDIK